MTTKTGWLVCTGVDFESAPPDVKITVPVESGALTLVVPKARLNGDRVLVRVEEGAERDLVLFPSKSAPVPVAKGWVEPLDRASPVLMDMHIRSCATKEDFATARLLLETLEDPETRELLTLQLEQAIAVRAATAPKPPEGEDRLVVHEEGKFLSPKDGAYSSSEIAKKNARARRRQWEPLDWPAIAREALPVAVEPHLLPKAVVSRGPVPGGQSFTMEKDERLWQIREEAIAAGLIREGETWDGLLGVLPTGKPSEVPGEREVRTFAIWGKTKPFRVPEKSLRSTTGGLLLPVRFEDDGKRTYTTLPNSKKIRVLPDVIYKADGTGWEMILAQRAGAERILASAVSQ